MKKFLRLFLILVFIFIFVILIMYFLKFNKENTYNEIINERNTIQIESIDIEETKEILSYKNIESPIASINESQYITQYDINFQKFIEHNISKSQKDYIEKNDSEILNECIKRKVIVHEATNNSIKISETERNQLENYYKNLYSNDDDIIAETLGISKEEYTKKLLDNVIENRIITKYHNIIIKEIVNNNLQLNNEKFTEKKVQFDIASDISEKSEILEELYEIYIEELISKNDIEIFNKEEIE